MNRRATEARRLAVREHYRCQAENQAIPLRLRDVMSPRATDCVKTSRGEKRHRLQKTHSCENFAVYLLAPMLRNLGAEVIQ